MSQTAFVGTYTDGESEGIYTLDIAVDNAVQIECRDVTPVANNPSFVTLHPDESMLYAVHEVEEGGVTAFAIETGDEPLARRNNVESGASGPCHCSVHPSGDYLFVAHYTGAAVSAIPIREDGQLAEASAVVEHEGSSAHPDRQTRAHPHSITPGPDGHFVYVPDLGTDEVVIYEFDIEEGVFDRVGAVTTTPGAGPRHFVFHPAEPYAYLINELDSTIVAYSWDRDTGDLTESTTVSTVPDGYTDENYTADIHVHPTGRFLYGSNRGHDSIVAYSLQDDPGSPALVGHFDTGGEWPRNFAFDTTGRIVFAENQRTDDINAFTVELETGELRPTGTTVNVPSPVCLCCTAGN